MRSTCIDVVHTYKIGAKHMGCSVVVLCKILLKVVPSTLYYYIVLVFFQVTAGYKSCFSKSWVKKSGPNGRGRFSFSDGSK